MNPVIALHGFAGHGDSWNRVRAAYAGSMFVSPTLFGHDPSRVPTARVTFEDEVARVVAIIRDIGGSRGSREPVRLCGYSMGARIALGVFAHAPELVSSLLLIGVNPGLKSDAERTQRAAADDAWAELLETDGLDAFAAKWESQALFASQRVLAPEVLDGQRTIRMRHDPKGLAMAMASLSLARMPSYWELLPRLDRPVDLVVGSLDTKFTALAREIEERLPPGRGRVLSVEGAGHNVLLERPELVARAIAG